MKAIALIMVVGMFFLTAFAGGVKAMQPNIKSCCHHTAKHLPCHHNQKSDCEQSMCTSFTCNTCGFLIVKCLSMEPLAVHTVDVNAVFYYAGNLSTYCSNTWQPPRV